MNKYIKPAIKLLDSGTTTGATSSCSTSTEDAKEIMDILTSMGYNPDYAFGVVESCQEMVTFEDYCKFTSSIQVFFS